MGSFRGILLATLLLHHTHAFQPLIKIDISFLINTHLPKSNTALVDIADENVTICIANLNFFLPR